MAEIGEEQAAPLGEDDLAELNLSFWEKFEPFTGARKSSYLPERAAAEIRRLRASLAERDEMLGKAGEAVKPLTEFLRLETFHGETIGHEDLRDGEHVSINTSGGLSVIVGTVADLRRAASLASEIKEKQG